MTQRAAFSVGISCVRITQENEELVGGRWSLVDGHLISRETLSAGLGLYEYYRRAMLYSAHPYAVSFHIAETTQADTTE